MSSAAPTPRTLRAATAASLAADAATVEVVEALGERGLEAILLKGPALARLLYEAGEERSWDDADLLVDPSRYRDAVAILRERGFCHFVADEASRGSVPHAEHLVREHEAGVESIDLHRSFAGVGTSPDSFWESVRFGADAIELFGRRVQVPSVPARLALVALHAASHGRRHLRSMRDLGRALERLGADEWAAAAQLAADWDALDYFVVGLRLDPAGGALLAAIGVEHDPGATARIRGEGMPRAQRGLEQLARADGVAARLRLILLKTFLPPASMRLWKPLARRGPLGLALAYAWRPVWLVGQLVPALRAYLAARRA
jgi:hypothetical protein